MIKAVLFDFDDTLVDTVHSKIPAIIEYCDSVHGVAVTVEEVLSLWGMPFWETMKVLSKADSIQTDRYLAISEKHPLRPFPESEEVVRSLHSEVTIGIVTSLARPVLLHSLNALGWSDIPFSVIVTEGEAPAHKPDPRVFDPALAILSDIQPDDITYVGDALSDAKAATRAGLQFIGIAREAQRQAAFGEAGFRWEASLAEIARGVGRSREPAPRM